MVQKIVQIDMRLMSQWYSRLMDIEVKGINAIKLAATLQEMEHVIVKGDGLINEGGDSGGGGAVDGN
jgi:hypothetical protein